MLDWAFVAMKEGKAKALDMLDKSVDSGPCAWQTFRKTWALINIPPAGARNSPT